MSGQEVIWVKKGAAKAPEGAEESATAIGRHRGVRQVRVLKEVDSRMENLPPFPTVLSELIGLTNSDNSAADDLRGCIEKDAVLTARILKLANSAFYSPAVPVASVQQAVVMLGFLSVRSLAMAAATLKFLGQEIEAYGIGSGGLWMHSYAAAELAREFAVAADEPPESQDEVYVGGLLHDIGKIVLGGIMEGLLKNSADGRNIEEEESVRDWELRIADISHCEVGERLADKWRLAPVTTACVLYHHDWEESPADVDRAVKLVSLANVTAHRLGVGFENAAEDPERETRLLDQLGITGERAAEILEDYSEKIADVTDLFSNMK